MILIGVSACSVSQNTARESDGIYYDPTSEPERRITEETYPQNEENYVAEQPVRIGGRYFDDSGNAPETETYYDDDSYVNDRNVVSTQSNNDHVQWGDYQGVDVYVNNYYGWNRPFYNRWYSPRWNWNFGWNFGWNSWGFRPWYSGYYGYGFPYYGYGGYYGPFHPYYGYGYSPYYPGYYGYGYYGGSPYYNNYYGNRVMREVTRGRGISNGVTRDLTPGQRDFRSSSTAVRREAPTVGEVRGTRDTQTNVSPRTRVSGEVNNANIRTPNRRESNVTPDADTSPVRIRPRTSEEVNTNSGIRTNPRNVSPNPRQTTPNIRQQQQTPTRYNTPRTQPQQRQRNVSPPPTRNQNVTPSRTPSRSNRKIGRAHV